MSKRYVIWACADAGNDTGKFIDKEDGNWGSFDIDEQNRITGEFGDCFFSSLEEVEDFLNRGMKRESFLANFPQTCDYFLFFVYDVGDVDTIRTTISTKKEGIKEDSEYSYFTHFTHEKDFEFEKEYSYSEFEEIVFNDAFGGGAPFVLVSKHVSKWIMDNFDLIRKYKGDY